jgi:hypothetical protein
LNAQGKNNFQLTQLNFSRDMVLPQPSAQFTLQHCRQVSSLKLSPIQLEPRFFLCTANCHKKLQIVTKNGKFFKNFIIQMLIFLIFLGRKSLSTPDPDPNLDPDSAMLEFGSTRLVFLLPYLALILGIVAHPVVGNLVPQSLLHMPIFKGEKTTLSQADHDRLTLLIQL